MQEIINQEIEHYIEWFYSYNPDMGFSVDSLYFKITDRDPSLFINYKTCAFGFRFFDKTKYTLNNGKITYDSPSNYSGMYYYGKRLNEEELLEVYNAMPYLIGIDSMIQCDCGKLITSVSEDDMTTEEYTKSLSEEPRKVLN